MAKIYDANGNKMDMAGICNELLQTMTIEQKQLLADAVAKYSYDNSHMKLAHGILDVYRLIDGMNEQGARVRKLLDNIMTKYQKSIASENDKQVFNNLIAKISE